MKIIYTHTDEAPALATKSLLPIISAFAKSANIDMETADISLSGRILAAFSDHLPADKKQNDDLNFLGNYVKDKNANIIKLPNISASVPQLQAAISELQQQGYPIPDYPLDPQNTEEKEIQARYDKIKGSAVNPVLREGNSDRRAPQAVKNFARRFPHHMGEWTKDSKTHVATMTEGDFFHNEQSITLNKETTVHFVFHKQNGEKIEMRAPLKLQKGEILDATLMEKKALQKFLTQEILDAKEKGVLFSIHLKATMMKVSDPVIFGEVVRTFFAPVLEEYQNELGDINLNNGLVALENKLKTLDENSQKNIKKALESCLNERPELAMVDSDKGISNLHVPSDVIIDASMPAMIKSGGKMWDKKGKTQDCKAVIPDSSYAGIYQAVIDFCREYGAFDPRTMGSVPNVGLMAQKAEEYGSHDKTFIFNEKGRMEIIDENGEILSQHQVEKGDIWRACQSKDAAIQDWIALALKRAKLSNTPAVFWLDKARPHDRELIKKLNHYLSAHSDHEQDIRILSPKEACRYTLERLREGKDTISVTGNVLRDYLTDLFPILELGTSAKMLSIVPLMAGGGMFETGAGGSAPKHVQQLQKENHLRWDSLGEFLALSVSLEELGQKHNNKKAKILAKTLDKATENLLLNDKSPKRKAGEDDNRTSHYWLARYWAEALSEQEDQELQKTFQNLAKALQENEEKILSELKEKSGGAVDMGGYYHPDVEKLKNIMRPSATFNNIIDNF